MRARQLWTSVLWWIAAAAWIPGTASAQGADRWQFQASIYGYLPSIGGTTTFPPGGGGGSSVTVDSSNILDNLNFAFMGSFEAAKGPYGVYTDVVYFNLGSDRTQSRDITIGGALPAGATADIHYDLKGLMWTLAGMWRAVAKPGYKLDVLAGTRMLRVDQTLNWQLSGNIGAVGLPDRAGSRSTNQQNWDAIVGVKGRAALGDGGRWFAPYYFDIGLGESKFTWQAIAGVGYSFGWGDLVGVWRYVDYEMKSGKPVESLNFSGPALAAVFRW